MQTGLQYFYRESFICSWLIFDALIIELSIRFSVKYSLNSNSNKK